jgi:hypothetical protein
MSVPGIDAGEAKVSTIRAAIAKRFGYDDPGAIRLIFGEKELRDDGKRARDEGLHWDCQNPSTFHREIICECVIDDFYELLKTKRIPMMGDKPASPRTISASSTMEDQPESPSTHSESSTVGDQVEFPSIRSASSTMGDEAESPSTYSASSMIAITEAFDAMIETHRGLLHYFFWKRWKRSFVDVGQLWKAKQDKRFCIICGDRKTISHYPSKITDRCGHETQVCDEDLQRWIASQLDSQTWDKLRCPECGLNLQHEDVRAHGSPDFFERYVQIGKKRNSS